MVKLSSIKKTARTVQVTPFSDELSAIMFEHEIRKLDKRWRWSGRFRKLDKRWRWSGRLSDPKYKKEFDEIAEGILGPKNTKLRKELTGEWTKTYGD